MKNLILYFLVTAMLSVPVTAGKEEYAAGDVLDAFHRAAAAADWQTYFDQMDDNGVFLGTDITERWTKKQFQKYAEQAKGGWTYIPKERNLDLTDSGDSIFFDEILLSEKYGYCRGTGVLIRTASGWKIAQYHLTFPIPNSEFIKITQQIQQLVADQLNK